MLSFLTSSIKFSVDPIGPFLACKGQMVDVEC